MDLPRDARQADHPQRPGRQGRAGSRSHQVFGLVHLHRHILPCIARRTAQRQPPEPASAHGPMQRPFGGRPCGINHVRHQLAGRRHPGRRVAVRRQPDILRPLPQQQQVERHPLRQHQHLPWPGRRRATSACSINTCIECSTIDPTPTRRRRRSPACAAVRTSSAGIAIARYSRGKRCHRPPARRGGVTLPELPDHRSQQQAGTHHGGAGLDYQARPVPIHQPAKHRAEHSGDRKAEGKGTGCHAAFPAELRQDRRKQGGEKRGARSRPHAYGNKHHGDDHPVGSRAAYSTRLRGRYAARD